MASLFSRYRPPTSVPQGLYPPVDDLAGASLPSEFDSVDYASQNQSDPDVDTSNQDATPRALYSDSTGPAQKLDSSTPPTPSTRLDAMNPAGKVPATNAAPPPTPQNSSLNVPVPPPGMEGAPQPPDSIAPKHDPTMGEYAAQDAAALRNLKAPEAPKTPTTTMGKIGSGVLDYLAARTGMPRHPIYGQQLAAYNQQAQDLEKRVGLEERAENLQSLGEARLANADARTQTAYNNAISHGITFAQPGQQMDPKRYSAVVMPPGLQAAMGKAVAYHDNYFGKFLVDGKLAETAGLKPDWYPKETLDKVLEIAAKRDPSTLAYVTPETAKKMDIAAPPGKDGLVAVPVSALNKLHDKENPTQKTPDDEERYVLQYLKEKGLPDTIDNRNKAFEMYRQHHGAPEHQPTINVMVPNGDGGYTAQSLHPGQSVGPGAVTAAGMNAQTVANNKATDADKKAKAAAQQEYQLAQTLVNQPSATNDLALVMRYIGATKPDSLGKLRLNNNEVNLVLGTRSAFGNLDALAQKIKNGQMLTPQQRQDMLGTMRILAGINDQYAHTATGPNGHKIGSNDGKTWFDVQTGKQIQ